LIPSGVRGEAGDAAGWVRQPHGLEVRRPRQRRRKQKTPLPRPQPHPPNFLRMVLLCLGRYR